jgi:ubiquinol-cytochrome c reductase cytochrome b subunit
MLGYIGSQHPVEPFVFVGQVSTFLYFAYFIIIVPVIGIVENTLFDISLNNKTNI